MNILRVSCFALLATGLLAGSAHAQNNPKPLDLTLPPSSGFPVASTSTAATTQAPAPAASSTERAAPGVYYGDTSGAKVAANNPNDAADSCDDATYNKPRTHGSVSTGVVAGNHVSGNYQSATVNITKPLGDCKRPTGTLSITAHVSQGRFGYRGSH